MEKEIWKPVVGFEETHEVSSLGNVRSVDRVVINSFGHSQNRKGVLLSPTITHNGYLRLELNSNGISIKKAVHRLVADAFIPHKEGMSEVNHKNGLKRDNRSTNLEWCTPKMNSSHAVENGLRPLGENHPMSKFSVETVLSIRYEYANGTSQRALAAKYRVAKNSIQQIVNRQTWKHI